MMHNNNTICAIATAQGGAIGIIRVSGIDAITIVDSIISKDIRQAKGYTLHFCEILDKDKVIDEVLVSVFRTPHSYTGEDSVEISCHGSRFILQHILKLLMQNGCSMATPGEFTQRAFLNGKMDLTQAEAVADLIASNNATQHRVAMNQLRGGITTKLQQLREELLHLTSLLELELDFSDHEDIEFADRSEIFSIAQQIEREIKRLLDSYDAGNAIKTGIPVAIIGAPNVGKSTLLNQLLQDDRAIVSDIAGTTRDTIEDSITISGYQFRFIDTAGIHITDDKVESIGIERSLQAARKAQIIILMRDDNNDYPTLVPQPTQTIIKIHNKTSEFSALTGKGIDTLKSKLLDSVPATDTIVTETYINGRHKEILTIAMDDIQRAIKALTDNIPTDLVSEDTRSCVNHLAEITGSISTDDVLGNIFKNFCIGK